MDLVASVRKEGSRGGRADFKWSDVQTDQHRENYLGHSLMAPVGRWQKGRDLQWYARSGKDDSGDDGLTPEERAKQERDEEIQRVKEAEREALSKALGYEVNPDGPLGSGPGTGANSVAVAPNDKMLQVSEDMRDAEETMRGKKERRHRHRHRDERGERQEKRHRRRRHRSRSRSASRSRSVSRDRGERRHKRRSHYDRSDELESHPRRRSRERSYDRYERRRDRSGDRERKDRRDERYQRSRSRDRMRRRERERSISSDRGPRRDRRRSRSP